MSDHLDDDDEVGVSWEQRGDSSEMQHNKQVTQKLNCTDNCQIVSFQQYLRGF